MKRDKQETDKPASTGNHLRPVGSRGNLALYSIIGAGICVLCLFLLTGLSSNPLLFLLYPLFIGLLILCLGTLAIHLLRNL